VLLQPGGIQKKHNMKSNNPGLFGITHSNRDFENKSTWGKNQFNSSFPASLSAYLHEKGFENVYLKLDKNCKVVHQKISTSDFFGLQPTSDDLFYSFESAYTPYEQLVIGHLPRVDLVTQRRSSGTALKPIEIKLTALPDHTTAELSENNYGAEIVIRPDTIVYLACSIAFNFRNKLDVLKSFFSEDVTNIKDWSEGTEVWPYIHKIIDSIDNIALSNLDKQEPIVMQPIWKTIGKSPTLAENCLDVFVWSNLAFTQLFLDSARGDLPSNNQITRQIRTVIWLFKMLYDFAHNGRFNHAAIIDELSYNTKNDKAFAMSGTQTRQYMNCNELHNPRIRKEEIKYIILGGGQELLSPERRFDAIICNSPELF
jgi:hypothetical protein